MRSIQTAQPVTVKGHGYIKKSKAYGAIGAIALGGLFALAVDNPLAAYAEEVDPIKTDGAETQVIEAEVTSSEKDEAVEKAKAEGVKITEEADVSYDSLSEAEDDIKKQTEDLKEAEKQKLENTQAIEEAEAKNAEIAKRNEEGQKAVDEKNAKIEAEKAAIEERNKKAQEEFEKATEESVLKEAIEKNIGLSLGFDAFDTAGDPTASISMDEEGNFTITNTDWVDRADIGGTDRPYGYNVYTGKIDYTFSNPTNAGDIDFTIHSVTLNTFAFTYQFDGTVYSYPAIEYSSPAGDVMYYYSKTPGVNVNENVNATRELGYTGTLKAGQTSQWFDILNIFADWVIDSHYKLQVQFTNNTVGPIVEEPKMETYDGPEPETFTPEELVNVPDVLDAKASIHKVYIVQSPAADKSVENSEGADINGKMVVKGQETYWILNNEALKGGRDKITSYTITDTLPAEFEIDLAKTSEASKDYDVSYDAPSRTIVFRATAALLEAFNASPKDAVNVPAAIIAGSPLKDNMEFHNKFTTNVTLKDLVFDAATGKVTEGQSESTYSVESDEVYVMTPEVTPTKVNENEKGAVINGKTVLPGELNFYEMLWDLDQYKNIQADARLIAKGFYYVDDYPEDALDLVGSAFAMIDANGQKAEGISYIVFEKASKEVSALLDGFGIKPNGSFILFKADNPQAFFDKYVKTGTSITITAPMRVKKELAKTGGAYENTAWQIDFGNAFQTEIIENNVPKLETKKDVVIDVNSDKSLDGTTIELGKVFDYKLVGALVPKDRSDALWDYSFTDDYQETHDEYSGTYKVFAKVDIKTEDGKTIKAGEDLTKYTSQSVNKEKGVLIIHFDEEFLRSVGLDSEFQAEAFVQMKRIAAGKVENSFTNTVNGVEVVSNTVVTTTPEQPSAKGVNTGVELGTAGWSMMTAVSGLGTMLGLFRRKRK